MVRSNRPYELILRAREGLPFPALSLLEWLIKSSLSRSQRDNKVIICHYVWMANHAHILLVAQDPQDCIFFIQEVQKKITDALKRLLGLTRLNLWEGRPNLAEILDLGAAIQKIGYIYSNPAKASLVDSINSFPGVSTWKEFNSSPEALNALTKEDVPRLRLNILKKLPTRSLTGKQDRYITQRFKDHCGESQELTIQPNAWMKAFGIIEPSDVFDTNLRIKTCIKLHEQHAREKRTFNVCGPEYLRREPIMKSHTASQPGRKIFVISSCKELRISFIEKLRIFIDECKECYRQWKSGNFSVLWPPGAFRPSLRPAASAI